MSEYSETADISKETRKTWIYKLSKSELQSKLKELNISFREREATVDELRKTLSNYCKNVSEESTSLSEETRTKMTSYNIQLQPFDGEKWESFQQQLECIIQLNEIPQKKKVPLLLTKITPKVFETLTYLCSPDKPVDLDYENLCIKLRTKYTSSLTYL